MYPVRQCDSGYQKIDSETCNSIAKGHNLRDITKGLCLRKCLLQASPEIRIPPDNPPDSKQALLGQYLQITKVRPGEDTEFLICHQGAFAALIINLTILAD